MMLEPVSFIRFKYFADYCALTKRMVFPVRHYAMYSNNPPKKDSLDLNRTMANTRKMIIQQVILR